MNLKGSPQKAIRKERNGTQKGESLQFLDRKLIYRLSAEILDNKFQNKSSTK